MAEPRSPCASAAWRGPCRCAKGGSQLGRRVRLVCLPDVPSAVPAPFSLAVWDQAPLSLCRGSPGDWHLLRPGCRWPSPLRLCSRHHWQSAVWVPGNSPCWGDVPGPPCPLSPPTPAVEEVTASHSPPGSGFPWTKHQFGGWKKPRPLGVYTCVQRVFLTSFDPHSNLEGGKGFSPGNGETEAQKREVACPSLHS